MPIQQGTITSPFGIRTHPITHRTEFHRGLDISTAAGNPVRATADGIVSFSGWNGSGGNVVVVEHGYGFSTYYAHNKMNMVEVGQKVKKGAVLGYVGSTGNATGSHVHYEVWHDGKSVNPIGYIQGGA
jgi:murein DD-endopeptidase MepM/ murein hydrolase activator NlpD